VSSLAVDAVIAYLTQYLGLGVVFFVGLGIAWRQGDVGLRRGRARRWLGVLLCGYTGYAAAHAYFQFGALP
jgi:hypothetical protein